ncbi:endo-polygalacturonase [Rickenella mellea]|uniref:endo-polygalacturonase n=1 Tax=Rickenella mellea TaxID=50990 RepID=A0A4Y7Q909_9AGAM|nr:endo-polygalacturonase [Rickenella mellea]
MFYNLLAVSSLVAAVSACTGTINSLSDVSAAVKCTTVNINGFTVPAGEGLILSLVTGTTVNLNGNIAFGNKSWAGPLFTISGTNIIFNGNGNSFDGGGPFYWDGQGSNGGTTKPRPMMKIKISGKFENVKVVNSPAQTFSVSNPAALTISGITIDNSQGDLPNSMSGGLPAGHNTDGFDASTTDLTISGWHVTVPHTQSLILSTNRYTVCASDDCLAINKGSNIAFTGNSCFGGHGISIGSIASGVTVSNITISNNNIVNNDQAIRIKMDATSTGSSVSGITYSGNKGSGLNKFGVLIDQSYPATLGTPGNGVELSAVNFVSGNVLSVNSGADRVAVNCGPSSCSGTWNWAGLTVTGGKAGPVNYKGISGGSF